MKSLIKRAIKITKGNINLDYYFFNYPKEDLDTNKEFDKIKSKYEEYIEDDLFEIVNAIIIHTNKNKWITKESDIRDYSNYYWINEIDKCENEYSDLYLKNIDIGKAFYIYDTDNEEEYYENSGYRVFKNCVFKNCDFSNCDFNNFNGELEFTRCIFDSCKFSKEISNITVCDSSLFYNCVFYNIKFKNVDLEVFCSDCNFNNTSFTNTNIDIIHENTIFNNITIN